MSVRTDYNAMTAEGYQELSAELQHLIDVESPRMLQVVRAARQDGDLHDNPALRDALEEQSGIAARIATLRSHLSGARIAAAVNDGTVGIGSFVTTRDTDGGDVERFELVSEVESDASRGRLSVEAPIGSSLLGLRAGALVTIDTPIGYRRLEILHVETTAPAACRSYE